MANLQYIGARYVPKFFLNPDDQSNDWKSGVLYEALTIVTYNNDSYTSKIPVPANIGDPASNPNYWACTTKYTAALMALQNSVGAIEDLIGDTSISEVGDTITESIDVLYEKILASAMYINHIDTDIVLDGFVDEPLFIQGATYYKNNQILAYFTNGTNNTGYLKCFSLSTFTEVWSYAIKGYHGNSLVYRDIDNCLYICACKDQAGGSPMDKIVVVDMANPSVVKEEITAPTVTICICYDAVNDIFYGCSTNATDIYRYNGLFLSIAETIHVTWNDVIHYNLVLQPCAYFKDGIIYSFGTETDYSWVMGHDAKTGKRVYFATMNGFINGYRSVGELEALFYNPYTNNFVMAAYSAEANICGVPDKSLFTIFNVGLYKTLNSIKKQAYDDLSTRTWFAGQMPALFVNNGADDLEPWTTKYATRFKCMGDLLNVMRERSFTAYHVVFSIADNSVMELADFDLEGFNGYIEGATGYVLEVHKLHLNGNNNIRFRNCHFVDSVLSGVVQANIFTGNLSVVHFDECEFDDFAADGAATDVSHIKAGRMTTVSIVSDTFNGSKDAVSKSYGSIVENDVSYEWKTTNGLQDYTTADTWQKCDFQFTVPAGRTYIVDIVTGGNASNSDVATGIAVTSQYVNDLTTNRYRANYYFEDSNGFQYTPMLFMQAGTYNLWLKRNATKTGVNYIVRYKDIT